MSNNVKNVIVAMPVDPADRRGFDELVVGLGGDFDYNAIMPMPVEILAQRQPIGNGLVAVTEEVWAWQYANWGTKNRAMDVEIDVARYHVGSVAIITFDSNNTPPIPVVTALSARFHGVTFVHQYRDVDLPDHACGFSFYMNGNVRHKAHRLNEEYVERKRGRIR